MCLINYFSVVDLSLVGVLVGIYFPDSWGKQSTHCRIGHLLLKNTVSNNPKNNISVFVPFNRREQKHSSTSICRRAIAQYCRRLRSFLRTCGNITSFDDNLVRIWNILTHECFYIEEYQPDSKRMLLASSLNEGDPQLRFKQTGGSKVGQCRIL